MGYLPTSKFGNCTICPAQNVPCVKKGKNLVCLNCNNVSKTEKQLENAKERDKLRGALRNQIQNGDQDIADRQVLINELDRIFSRIVRLRASDERSYCACFTCGTSKHWSMQQCGHYVKRGNTQLRWDFKNSKVQCKYCNENLAGNLKVYAENLDKEQPGLSEQLIEIGREVYHWSFEELKQLLSHLREQLRIAENIFKEKTGQKV